MKKWIKYLDYKFCSWLCGVAGRLENKLWRRLYVGKIYKNKYGEWEIPINGGKK